MQGDREERFLVIRECGTMEEEYLDHGTLEMFDMLSCDGLSLFSMTYQDFWNHNLPQEQAS